MPFQPINFAGIEPQGNEFMRNLAQNLTNAYKSGFEMKEMPGQVKRKREEDEFKNAMDKIKLEQAQNPVASIDDILKRKKLEAEIAKTNAETSNIINPKADPMAEWKLQLLKAQVQTAQNAVNNAQTPEQKQAALMALETHKSNLRKQEVSGKSKEDLTNTNKTANQSVIQSIDNTLPLIKNLQESLKKSEIPGQFVGQFFSPDQQAKYEGTVATITDALVGALNLPKTNESIALVKKVVGRRGNESEKSYKSRLESLVADLNERRKKAAQALKRFDSSQETAEEGGEYYDVETGTWKKS